MTGAVVPFGGLSPRDGPGPVRALARLADSQQFSLDPGGCDTAAVQHVKDALQDVLDGRVLTALRSLADTLGGGRSADPGPDVQGTGPNRV